MIVEIKQRPDDAQLETVCFSLVAGFHNKNTFNFNTERTVLKTKVHIPPVTKTLIKYIQFK